MKTKEYILSHPSIDIFDWYSMGYEYPPDEVLENCDLKSDTLNYDELVSGFPDDVSIWYVRKDASILILNETKIVSIAVANYTHPGCFEKITTSIQERLNTAGVFEFGDWETYDDMLIITKDECNQCYWSIYFENSWHAAIGKISFDALGGEDDDFIREIGKRINMDLVTKVIPMTLIDGKDYKFRK